MSFYTSSFKRFLWWGGVVATVLFSVNAGIIWWAINTDNIRGSGEAKLLRMLHNSKGESALFGSSVALDFKQEDFEHYFDFNTTNFALSGSTTYMRSLLLNYWLNPDRKTVFFEFFFLHSYNLNNSHHIHPYYQELINTDRINFLFSDYIVRARLAKRLVEFIHVRVQDRKSSSICPSPKTFDFINSNIDIFYEWSEFVEPIVLANPQITFYIYTPPIAYAYFARYGEEQLNAYLDIEERWIARAKVLPNVKLFDFRSLDSVRSDLSNYTDTVHYKPLINTLMVKLMSEDNLPPFDRATFLRGVANARLEAADRCGR
ncbi:hypothetical protein AGMMS50229_08690 [Campylobacterota bacterium]|nr:hypothetical protein AGMMS50229_08690 [Campylobacterota bacterium]